MENKSDNKEAVNQQQESALQKAEPQTSTLAKSNGLQMQSIDEMLKFADYVSKSPFAPKGMEKVGDIVVSMQMGAELGLSPMASLQSIAVINGRPSVYGDTALALVRASGELEEYSEEMFKDPESAENSGCRITLKRKGFAPVTEEFTVKDAKQAGLWGKSGPWSQYPKRMLKFRCRGFILRDQFGDLLKGLRTSEEVFDMPDVVDIKSESGSLVESVSEVKTGAE